MPLAGNRGGTGGGQTYSHYVIHDAAMNFIREHSRPEAARRYAAMVTLVDRQVGELLALLKELGIDETTIVFFSGDNGANDYFKSAEHPRGIHGGNKHPTTDVEFRGTKGTLYERGFCEFRLSCAGPERLHLVASASTWVT